MHARAMALLMSAAVVSLGVSEGAAGQAVQWSGNGHWYAVSSGPTTWPQARIECEAVGATLACTETAAEASFLRNSGLTTEQFVFVGLYQDVNAPGYSEPAGGWKWVSGESFDPALWQPNEPNNLWGDERYGELEGPGRPEFLNDVIPSGSLRFYIEWSADCNGDGIVDYGQCRDGSLPDYDGNNVPDCCEQGTTCVVDSYPVQWREEEGGNGHWYEMRSNATGGGFDAVRAAALAAGGDLASVQTQAEGDRIVALLHGSGQSYWLGGFQAPKASEPSDGWSWTDGSPWSYANWLPGEPNEASPGEDFLAANPDGQWNDGPQDALFARYAVEWSADCNGDGIVDYGQILLGDLEDVDANGVPDICESYAVPGEYPTIQAAIDAVPAGEYGLVSVAAGVYNESFSLNGKNVLVRGAAGGTTILDGAGLATSIAQFTGGEPSTAGIESLVLRNGTSGTTINPPAPVSVGGGLYGVNSSASVVGCRFEDCAAGFGGGAYVYNSTVAFTGCTFHSNDAAQEGGGLFLFRCDGAVSGGAFTSNRASLASAGSGSALKTVGGRTAGSTVLLEGCTVSGNTANVSASAIEHFDDASGVPGLLRIDGCTVTSNTSPLGAGGLVVIGSQSSCVLAGGTTVCGNAAVNVDGPYLIEGSATVCDCEADFLGDGFVTGADLGILLGAWGLADAQGTGDLDHDGLVTGADLAILLGSWGACP